MAALSLAQRSIAGLSDFVEIREGDAAQTLARDLPPSVDMLLLDGAKVLHGPVLSLVAKHLRVGAVVIADNADFNPEFLAYVRAPGSGYVLVPFASDVELLLRG
jgi:predicted O-methyltransferase YrrM